MVELLSRLTPGDLTAVFTLTALLGFGLLVGVVITVAHSIRRYHERRLAVSLVQDMLDRGMTVDDVVRVLSAAGLEDKGEECSWLPQRLRRKLAGTAAPAAQSETP